MPIYKTVIKPVMPSTFNNNSEKTHSFSSVVLAEARYRDTDAVKGVIKQDEKTVMLFNTKPNFPYSSSPNFEIRIMGIRKATNF